MTTSLERDGKLGVTNLACINYNIYPADVLYIRIRHSRTCKMRDHVSISCVLATHVMLTS